MKILILAHALRAGGGQVVGVNTIRALRNLDVNNDYFFIVPDQEEYRALPLDTIRHSVYYYRRRFSHLGRWVFDTFTLGKLVKLYQPDVVLGLGNLSVSAFPCAQAILLHNPYLVYNSRYTGHLALMDKLWLLFLRWFFKRSLSRVKLVFCQTSTMVSRLRSTYGYDGRTVVLENVISAFAVNGEGDSPPTLTALIKKFKIFYLTRYYPHKGLEMLVETMDRYREELSDTVAVITIAPEQHKNAARLLQRIKKRQLEDRIINVGPLAQKDLGVYYQACDCLVMPSRMESFSGTYLESMHFGLPILTSDLDFAREICGGAAIYFDPWDALSIKDAILRVKGDPNLREDLVAKGRKRLSESFKRTWEDIAADIKYHLESLISD